MVRTINGKRMSEATYGKRVRSLVRKAMGANYPGCAYDDTDIRYDFGCGRSTEESAGRIAEKRRMQPAERIPARIWIDEHNGETELRPHEIPAPVAETIRAAFANGCSHGTVSHWAERWHQCQKTGDILPQLYLWEKL